MGQGQPCFIVAEIGINHNGDLELAKRLIDAAVAAGCDAVKFQKRTVEVVYTPEELAPAAREPVRAHQRRPQTRVWSSVRPSTGRSTPTAERKDILWFASCWDEGSVDFIERFDPPCFKIASACLNDHALLRHTKRCGKPIVLSTGMSTMDQIDEAVEVLGH